MAPMAFLVLDGYGPDPRPPGDPNVPFPPPDIPGGGGGGGCCQPGQYCKGVCAEFEAPFGIILSTCIGGCSGGGNGPGDPMVPPPPDLPGGNGGINLCNDPVYMAACASGIAPPGVLQGAFETTCRICQGGGGGGGNGATGCGCPSTSCALPSGRRGKTNKSRYYRFGDCRRGTSAGVVQPNSVCVASRRTNYGNDKAAMRAARRISGAARHYKKMLDAVDSVQQARSYKKPRRKK